MPRIQEYLPETEDNANLPGVDPNLTQVQAAGAGIKSFGANVTEQLSLVDKRQQQTEDADVVSNVTQARADFTQKLQQQTADGTLNTGQFQKEYQDWVDGQSQTYNTPGARDYFQRQTARLGASLTRTASNGQVQIAYNNGKVSYQQALDNDVSTVTSDPTQQHDVLASNLENIDQMVSNGSLQIKDVPALQQNATQQLAIGALRGTYRKNPDLAQQMLDDPKTTSMLTPVQQEQMYNEVKTAKNAKQADQDRAIDFQKKQQEARDQHYMDQNFNGIQNGTVTAQQILASPLSFQKKNEAINMIKAASNEDMQVTNPTQYNNIVSRIGLPLNDPKAINDPGQLYKYAGAADPNQRLSTADIGKLRTFIDQSPGGQAVTANRKLLIDSAKATIFNTGTLNPIGYTSGKDPVGEYGLQRFTQALQAKEDELRQQNQPISSLYEVSSPNYFGKNISQYKPSPQMRFDMQYGQPTTKASPYVAAPNNPSKPTTKSPLTPPSGLTKQQFIKWKRDNGQ